MRRWLRAVNMPPGFTRYLWFLNLSRHAAHADPAATLWHIHYAGTVPLNQGYTAGLVNCAHLARAIS